jgi:hypothetical protein
MVDAPPIAAWQALARDDPGAALAVLELLAESAEARPSVRLAARRLRRRLAAATASESDRARAPALATLSAADWEL